MPKYRVVSGTHRPAGGERAEAGDIIDIPEERAEEFPQKFERVEQTETDNEDDADTETTDSEPETEESDTGITEQSAEEALAEQQADDDAEDESDSTPEGTSSEDIGDREASADIPDDYSLLSKMAKHYDGDEIHGAMSGDQIKSHLETLSDTEVAALKQKAREEMSEGD